MEVRDKWKSMWGDRATDTNFMITLSSFFFNEVIKLKINDSGEYLVVNK